METISRRAGGGKLETNRRSCLGTGNRSGRVGRADSRLQSAADVMGQRDQVGDPRLEAWDCWIDARMCRARTLNSVWSGGGSLHLFARGAEGRRFDLGGEGRPRLNCSTGCRSTACQGGTDMSNLDLTYAWFIGCSQHGGISDGKSQEWTGDSVDGRLKRRVRTTGDEE